MSRALNARLDRLRPDRPPRFLVQREGPDGDGSLDPPPDELAAERARLEAEGFDVTVIRVLRVVPRPAPARS